MESLDDVERFILEGYRAAGGRYRYAKPLGFGFSYGKLPLAVAEPGPLIERAVVLAGKDGLTLQRARRIFDHLGAERFERGLKFARGAGAIVERMERRPNRAGRLQQQVVFYAEP